MHDLLKFAQTGYITAQNLLPLLRHYTNPRDLLSRLTKKGELIRLKNGYFVIAEKIASTRVPFEQIANLLYGPSYISFEWALSYYGMIPEGVYVVTSACTGKTKIFPTPLGTFDYYHLSHKSYSIGLDQQKNSAGHFLIATPEKALADLVHLKCQALNSKDMLIDLIEGRRIDEQNLKNLDKIHLAQIADCYRSQSVRTLIQCIGIL